MHNVISASYKLMSGGQLGKLLGVRKQENSTGKLGFPSLNGWEYGVNVSVAINLYSQ